MRDVHPAEKILKMLVVDTFFEDDRSSSDKILSRTLVYTNLDVRGNISPVWTDQTQYNFIMLTW